MFRKILFLLVSVVPLNLCASSYDVTKYGVKSNSAKVQTEAIQKIVDLCASRGGGVVYLPSGQYVSGCLYLRDNVCLYLGHNAVLKSSSDLNDFPKLEEGFKGLVQAVNVNNVGICGPGIIDANGNDPVFHSGPKSHFRIHAANFEHCHNVTISDVSFFNASYWTLRLDDCDTAVIKGVKIKSTSYFNNDGIDLDGRNIVVSDCIIDCIDDAICIKSYYRDRPCENIAISNCIVSSNCNAIKLGTASHGGFKNISISDCVIRRPSQNDFFDYKKYIVPGITDNYTNNSGIALELVDGGIMEQISISNITMYNTLTPIFIRYAERRKTVPFGTMRGINISNVTATSNSLMTCSITGVPGHYAEDIKLSHIILNCPGGGLAEHTMREIPEAVKSYPENKIFGAIMPAYGFYVRHVNNLSLDDIQFRLAAADERYALCFEDCNNVMVDKVCTLPSHGGAAYISSVDTENLSVSNCRQGTIQYERELVSGGAEKRGRGRKSERGRGMPAVGSLNVALVKWSFREQTAILCDMAKAGGIDALDMVDVEKWDTVMEKGLKIIVADGVDLGVERGFCDRRWHKELQERYAAYLPVLAEKGIKQVVCYSGVNTALSSEEAHAACVDGLKPVVKMAEKLGIVLTMELLSSKGTGEIFTAHSFEHYACDSPEWGVSLCRALDSGNFRLLYDVWHMKDMGRDVFQDIKQYGEFISHYHINPDEDFDYIRFAGLLHTIGYNAYVGIEPDRLENKDDFNHIINFK